jgi:hypothetical protein
MPCRCRRREPVGLTEGKTPTWRAVSERTAASRVPGAASCAASSTIARAGASGRIPSGRSAISPSLVAPAIPSTLAAILAASPDVFISANPFLRAASVSRAGRRSSESRFIAGKEGWLKPCAAREHPMPFAAARPSFLTVMIRLLRVRTPPRFSLVGGKSFAAFRPVFRREVRPASPGTSQKPRGRTAAGHLLRSGDVGRIEEIEVYFDF